MTRAAPYSAAPPPNIMLRPAPPMAFALFMAFRYRSFAAAALAAVRFNSSSRLRCRSSSALAPARSERSRDSCCPSRAVSIPASFKAFFILSAAAFACSIFADAWESSARARASRAAISDEEPPVARICSARALTLAWAALKACVDRRAWATASRKPLMRACVWFSWAMRWRFWSIWPDRIRACLAAFFKGAVSRSIAPNRTSSLNEPPAILLSWTFLDDHENGVSSRVPRCKGRATRGVIYRVVSCYMVSGSVSSAGRRKPCSPSLARSLES